MPARHRRLSLLSSVSRQICVKRGTHTHTLTERTMQQPPPPAAPNGSGGGGGGPPRQVLARLRTEGYAGYSLAYSPFFPATLAVASSANFGLVGNGRLHVNALDRNANPFGNKM